jgi:AraC-like DNA-binding protein
MPAPRALPPDCSFRATHADVDRVVMRTSSVAVGKWRCDVTHPVFHDSGAVSNSLVAFPRTSVWIRHEGGRPFFSDPNVATIYNRGQLYERMPSSPDGDRCDYFAVSDEVAREIAAAQEPAAADRERPFAHSHAPTTGALYAHQRIVLGRADRCELDAFELDELVMGIVASVLAGAGGSEHADSAVPRDAARRHRDLAEATRAELARAPERNATVGELSRAVGTSPFHLCRVFRAETGRTMRHYRNELRVRRALELLNDRGARISTVAHTLGFASHSHFVRAAREHLAHTPSALRAALHSGAAR